MAGALQVRWHEELDSHVLYQGETRIAGHHNGFSCHNLAKRMLTGNFEYALAQFDYITDCGGEHYVTPEAFRALVTECGNAKPPD